MFMFQLFHSVISWTGVTLTDYTKHLVANSSNYTWPREDDLSWPDSVRQCIHESHKILHVRDSKKMFQKKFWVFFFLMTMNFVFTMIYALACIAEWPGRYEVRHPIRSNLSSSRVPKARSQVNRSFLEPKTVYSWSINVLIHSPIQSHFRTP